MTDLPGERSPLIAARYRIEKELGRGGSAVVHLARDTKVDRLVALKILRPELAKSVGAQRFVREVRLTTELEHPNILQVLDSGEHDGQPFCVLPYVAGGTLRERLGRETQLQLELVASITATLAGALDFAHSKRVIHRDVKPENVLMSGDTAYLADFGIARALEKALEAVTTSTGIVVGTPAYMSPEQAGGNRNLDRRSDVYSLGCVVYEMVSGMQAFAGPTPQSVIAQRLQYGPRPMHVFRQGIPDAIEKVVEKALAPVPADRYQTAGDLARAFSAAVAAAQLPTPVRRRSRAGMVASFAAAAVVVAAFSWKIASGRLDPDLSANKVVGFPLVRRGTTAAVDHVGDEATLLIGNALEHTEPLKWIDGWASLDSSQRANPATLTAKQARTIARGRGAKFYLQGSFIQRQDSATVVVELVDAAGDSVFARASASGRQDAASVPMLGLRAVIQLLPSLVEPTRKIDLRLLAERKPAAVASFVQGEREYRRSNYVEALAYYRRAVEADSAMPFAALKGAQAANWADRNAEARALVKAALAREAMLPAKYAHFAHGLEYFLSGQADSAVARFTSALDGDANWGEAWTALGETYFHLFPGGTAAANWDSLANVAFERARREDRDFAPPLFHLVEIATRAGKSGRAFELLQAFRQFHPDSTWVAQLDMTVGCARGAMSRADWNRWAKRYPMEAAKAAKTLAMVTRNYDCAEDGFRAALAVDSVPPNGRWMASFGLQSLLLARGRVGDARLVLDSVVAGGLRQAMALYIIDAAAGHDMGERATEAMKIVAGRYTDMPSYRLWYHARWETYRKNSDSLVAIDRALKSIVSKGATDEDRFFAAIVAAHLALLRADTASAIRLLRSLQPQGPPADVAWGFWEPLAPERMVLAQVLLARGEFDEAIRVANSFDHPQPVLDLVYLPASLVLRIRAARATKNPKLEATCRERLDLLGQRELAKSAL